MSAGNKYVITERREGDRDLELEMEMDRQMQMREIGSQKEMGRRQAKEKGDLTSENIYERLVCPHPCSVLFLLVVFCC